MTTLIRRNQNDTTASNRQAAGHDPMLHPYQVVNALLGWNPFLDEAPLGRGRVFSPAFEIREAKDAYLVKADVPGVRESDLDVTVTGNAVTISGRRELEADASGDQIHMMERAHGEFSRTFTVSDGADLEGLTADLAGGVLTVRIPKRPEVQPRKIALGKGGNKGSA
jgi:HSP20 family protein